MSVFQSQNMVSSLEKSLYDLQAENKSLKLQQQKVGRTSVHQPYQDSVLIQRRVQRSDGLFPQAAVTEEEKERQLVELQRKVSSLERRMQGNLSQDEHLQELLQEVRFSQSLTSC